jgi:hypothetical protein
LTKVYDACSRRITRTVVTEPSASCLTSTFSTRVETPPTTEPTSPASTPIMSITTVGGEAVEKSLMTAASRDPWVRI